MNVTINGALDTGTGTIGQGAYNGSFAGLPGVPPVPGGGTLTLTNSTIATSGDQSHAVLTRDGGSTTISGGSYSTSGAIADVIVGQGAGTSVNVSGATIAATGLGSPGASLVGAGSSMSLTNVHITTSGDPFASGRDAVGAFNGTSASGDFVGGGTLTITNSTIATSGDQAKGIVTRDGGVTTVSGGSVSTAGVFARCDRDRGLRNERQRDRHDHYDDRARLPRRVAGRDGFVDVAHECRDYDVRRADESGHNAVGAFNGTAASGDFPGGGTLTITNSTIATSGTSAIGVVTANGGSTTINGGSISTSGFLAFGILTQTGGTTTVGPSSVGPTTITTSGNDAPVVIAQSGAFVSLTGATVSATGAMGSSGLVVHDAGSELDASNVTVTTTGGANPATGRGSYGLFNGPFGSSVAGGVAKITNSSISTMGAQMAGVFTSTGGSTTINGGSITTSGFEASAILSENGGSTNVGASSVGPTTVTTTGLDAPGVQANMGGAATLSGGAVTTSGAGSGGPLRIRRRFVDCRLGCRGYDERRLRPERGQQRHRSVRRTTEEQRAFSGGSITTTGASADAVVSTVGSSVTLNGGTAILDDRQRVSWLGADRRRVPDGDRRQRHDARQSRSERRLSCVWRL